jgi:predicted DCC family thiol-disulfide oxidoreductase YuxK
LLVYDGDCGFCASRVKRWRRFIGEAVDFMALQEERVAEKLPDLSRTQLTQAVHLIEPDGSICCGAEAVFRLLAFKNRLPLWLYRRVPGFAQCAAFFYRLVARHRSALR